MKNPFKRKESQDQNQIGFLSNDDSIVLPLKLIAIGAASVLFFGFTPIAALAFFLGLNIWLVSRTAKLTLVNANQAEAMKQYIVTLERRVRDLESAQLRPRFQQVHVASNADEGEERLEKAS